MVDCANDIRTGIEHRGTWVWGNVCKFSGTGDMKQGTRYTKQATRLTGLGVFPSFPSFPIFFLVFS